MRLPRALVLSTPLCIVAFATGGAQAGDWRVTGSDPANSRYSPLDQISRANVAQLRVAWTFHTGDLPANGRGEIQATPIVVGGVLYTTTPALAVVALRAEIGRASCREGASIAVVGVGPW